MLAECIDNGLRQSEGPARLPGLRVAVFANGAPHCHAGRDRRVSVWLTIKVDLLPRQPPRFLGTYPRLEAEGDVDAEPVPLRLASDIKEPACLGKG